MSALITASMLYDLVTCPHRVTMDLYGDPAKMDETNPFVQLLWEKGSLFEKEVIDTLETEFVDLHAFSSDERGQKTSDAMKSGATLIYGGRISCDRLLGDPDLLRKEVGGYVAGDIKSGAGEEGPEDLTKPKKHYAVQLGLYTDILERNGLSAGKRAFVWDINGEEIVYDFTELLGKRNPRTLWQDYEEVLAEATAIIQDSELTLPAASGVCKLCHWYTACMSRLSEVDDLTLIPELGRAKRDTLLPSIQSVSELAEINPQDFIQDKKTLFAGIGPDMLLRFHERAKLISSGGKAYLHSPIKLPTCATELFFDIEVDPIRDICYLHGFVERENGDNSTEKFVAFFADKGEATDEKNAFSEAINYFRTKNPCAIYYYSKYERTIYRKLQEKYPDVCTADEIEALFDPAHAVDLYFDVVKKATEWPTRDHSIKTLAKYLGFSWRDTHPSGAASIEWFDRWIKTRDVEIKKRILEYNEDDCIATRVLLDGIRAL